MKCQIKITICVKAVSMWWMVTQMMFDIAKGRNRHEEWKRAKRRLFIYPTTCLVWKLFLHPFVLLRSRSRSLSSPAISHRCSFIFMKIISLSDPKACGIYSLAFWTMLQNVSLCCITRMDVFFTFIHSLNWKWNASISLRYSFYIFRLSIYNIEI